MCPDPGWVFHEPGEDGVGYSGWVYHYADGVMVTVEGQTVELADPGWVFHEHEADDLGYSGWVYHYADGEMVTEDGVVLPVREHADAALSPGHAVEPPLDPDLELALLSSALSEPTTELEPELEPKPAPEPAPEPAPVPAPEPAPVTEPTPVREPGPEVTLLTTRQEWRPRLRRRGVALLAGWRLNLRLASAHAAARVRGRVRSAAALLLVLVLVLVGIVVTLTPHRPREHRAPPTATTSAPRLTAPRAVSSAGEYVQTQVTASGDLQVEHWIRSTQPISTISLAVPPVADRAGVTVRELVVESDRGDRSTTDRAHAGTLTYSLHQASIVHLRYVLSGAVVRSSTPGSRALAQVTALDLSYRNDRVPRTLVLQGGRLLAVACSTPAANAAPRPCGHPDRLGWRVRLGPRTRTEQVMAQLDLP
jgi:hypothetical protein